MDSLITIHYNREEQLNNLLRGVARSARIPSEILIINMGKTPAIASDIDLPLILHQIKGEDAKMLPISEARNIGASLASYNVLHFLDVDCIPSKQYFDIMFSETVLTQGLFMGTPYYLSSVPKATHTEADLIATSVPHPRRPIVNSRIISKDPGLFWSLCFTISQEVFTAIGKFDVYYKGYGAEDTDLSFTCQSLNIPFLITNARVYHQQHGFHRPPLDKVEAIVHNCNHFYSKWNFWPMEKYLYAFAKAGYINWKPELTKPIATLQKPSEEAICHSYVNNEPFL